MKKNDKRVWELSPEELAQRTLTFYEWYFHWLGRELELAHEWGDEDEFLEQYQSALRDALDNAVRALSKGFTIDCDFDQLLPPRDAGGSDGYLTGLRRAETHALRSFEIAMA